MTITSCKLLLLILHPSISRIYSLLGCRVTFRDYTELLLIFLLYYKYFYKIIIIIIFIISHTFLSIKQEKTQKKILYHYQSKTSFFFPKTRSISAAEREKSKNLELDKVYRILINKNHNKKGGIRKYTRISVFSLSF